MTAQDEFRLSFYRDIETPGSKENVTRAMHIETGEIFMKKTLPASNVEVYKTLRDASPAHIPAIREIIEDGDSIIVIEEYIQGRTLADILEDGVMTDTQAESVMIQLCNTLQFLHSCKPAIIHRDIKPSNLILNNSNTLYLIDFDASRTYAEGESQDTVLMGTQHYAAPEQYGFGQSDERADIYAAGVVLNLMLTGKFPDEELCKGKMRSVVKKCTQMDPRKRFQSAMDLKLGVTDGTASSLPPGFRSGDISHMIIAICGYAGILFISLRNPIFETDPDISAFGHFCERIFSATAMLLLVFYVFNYRGFRDIFPFSKNLLRHTAKDPGNASPVFRILNMLRIIVGAVLVFLGPIVLLALLEGFFSVNPFK